MKIRQDFVTNSSSSSYLCLAKVDVTDELRTWIKEEYGKFGERLLKEQLITGAQIKADTYCEAYDILEDYDLMDEVKDDDYYLVASFIEWTNDGDTEGDDAFLYDILPEKYKHEIYNGGE